jgi:3-oxoacyl-(acyl-carrier-protein) synthase
MGASGALEAIATIIALEAQIVPPTLNFLEVDPDCAIDVTPHVPAPHAMRHAMSNSFGFGGLNGVLIFEAGR